MFTVILIMLFGVAVGRLLRGRGRSAVSRAITFFIWLLLFLLGVEVGANPRVVGSLLAVSGSRLWPFPFLPCLGVRCCAGLCLAGMLTEASRFMFAWS